jgi:flagellin
MRINTNVNAMTAQESATQVNKNLRNSLEKLSSGLRINKASDDASGLAIADKLRTQASSIKQSVDNATSASALIQIADKAMGEQSNILDIVKTKLIQANTATTSNDGADAILNDIKKLLTQLDNIASQTNYNGINLLQKGTTDTDAAEKLEFQVGELKENIITMGSAQSNTKALSLTSLKDDIASGESLKANAGAFMDRVDAALTTLNELRSEFGSTQNQLESATRNLMTTETNIKAAESVIRDVDYAQESANFNKQNIVSQAGTYAMSQANSIQQNVLRLLQ